MHARDTPDAGRRATVAALVLAVLAGVAWSAAAGPSWSWDRAHYHVYAGWQWLHGTLGRGFLPAGGQTFLNPLAYVPATLMSQAGRSELAIASALAAFQGLATWAVWLVARDRLAGRVAPALAAAFAFFTPVYLAQLGTSYIDATTAVGVLLGAWACRRAGDAGRPAAAWAAAGGVAIGIATGLKLSNALPLAVAPLLFAFASTRSWPPTTARPSASRPASPRAVPASGTPTRGRLRRRVATLAAYAAGASIGLAVATGGWSATLYDTYGNPFFPILDRVFNPPAPAPAAVQDAAAVLGPAASRTPLQVVGDVLRASGGRFVPASPAAVASFPFRVADPRLPANQAYLEWHAPDPRLVLLIALWGGAAAVALRRRLRGRPAFGRPSFERPSGASPPDTVPGPTPRSSADVPAAPAADVQSRSAAGTPAASAVDAPLAAFLVAWAVLWLYSSANGRYAVALLMLCSVPIVQAAVALTRPGRVRGYALAALLAVQGTFAVVAGDRPDVAPDARWSDAALEVELPASLRESPWLHVPTTVLSWSYLLPSMHPDSSIANLAAVCRGAACPSAMHVSHAAEVLRTWSGRVRMLMPVNELRDGAPRLAVRLRERYDAEFAEFDLRIDAPACEFFRVRPNLSGAFLGEAFESSEVIRPSDWVASCPLVAAEPGAAARARATIERHDAVFDAIERDCAARLGLGKPRTRWFGEATWVRDYPSNDSSVRISGGTAVLARMGRAPRVLGTLDALSAPGARIDCGAVPPA